MPLWPRILSLWRNVSRGEQVDRDLDEEIRAHLDMLIEEKLSSGMSQEEARRAALIEFGGADQTKEQVRASRTGFLLETLWQDLRFGFRMLVRSPGFTSAAVISLALGIGSTTAVFSIVDTIFLRPLPYPEPDRLVGITENQLGKPEAEGWMIVSTPTFLDWKQQSQSFDMLTQSRGTIPSVLNRSDWADMILTKTVSDGYFAMLGAARTRLLRQLLTESLLLSVLGAALGLLLAYGGVQLAVYLSPEYVIPRAAEISVDVRILGFVVTVACLTALLFGLFPALTAPKPDLNESLKEGGCRAGARPGARRVQGALVVAQIALSLVLLIGAGLMMHNTWRVLYANVGFNTEHMMQMYIRLSRDYLESVGEGSPYVRMRPKATLTIQEITSRLKALPGVIAVSVTTSGVLDGCNSRPVGAEATLPKQDYEQAVCYESVGPGYFRMLGIPLLKGRDFIEEDSRNSAPVAVISQSAAQRYFAGQNPVGKMINIGIWDTDEVERRQVAGVVGDVQWGVFHPDHAAVYYPYAQLPARFSPKFAGEYLWPTFLVRSASDPANLAHAMEQAAREVAKDLVIQGTWTADYTRRLNSQRPRFYAWLLATFAGIALVLAAVGIFGVMSYAVTRRTHEIGIRMALGAHPGNVLRLILYAGIRLMLTGIAIGLASVLGLARFLRSWFSDMQFNEVKPTDPATLAAVCLVLAVVALLACYIPARRAARMNPLTSLRYE